MANYIHKYKNFNQEVIIPIGCDVDFKRSYTYILPEPPNLNEIDGYGLSKQDQKFIRYIPPKDLKSRTSKERTEIEVRELGRRDYHLNKGYWFFNNGNLEWMTPHHYMYCNYWYTQDVIAEWRDNDRDFFYVWDIAEKDEDCYGLIYLANRREGKALDIETEIPTTEGFKKMKDLKVGDTVFGSDGKPTKITFVSDIMYNHTCYDVVFSDGSVVKADEEHLWIAYDKLTRAKLSKDKNIPPKVVNTNHIKETLRYLDHENNWSIVNTKPVEYSKKELEIPPYIFGLWLGDGNSRASSITSVDDFIIEKWIEYAKEIDCSVKQLKHDRISYLMSGNNSKWSINPFREKLKALNVMKNKHIPKKYLESSIEDRMELLMGIMDTDGHKMKNRATCEMCTKHKHFAEEFLQLINSLGFKGRVTGKLNKKYNRTYYYVRFDPNGISPFKLPRKKELVKENGSYGWNGNHRYITAVRPTESVPVLCIAVDNKDHSYLCTKSYIVTHNTFKSTCIGYNRATSNNEHLFAIQSKTTDDGRRVFQKVVNSWKKLPYYLKPIDTGETSPKKRILFQEPSRKNHSQNKDYGQVLDSEIFFASSEEQALDGNALGTIYNDEIGKHSDSNIHERYYVQKYTLTEGNIIKGKSINTSTVEEMEGGGGKNCKLLWDESQLETRKHTNNNQTVSGLIPYFKPADYGFYGKDPQTGKMFIDAYGYSNRDLAKKYIQNSRKNKSGATLISEIRKMPLNISEAFYVSAGESPFDVVKLNEIITRIQIVVPKPYYKMNLEWKERDREIRIVPKDFNSHAKFFYSELPDEKLRNNVGMLNGHMIPLNTSKYSMGADPYDVNQISGQDYTAKYEVGGSGGSLGAAHVMRKFDPFIDVDKDIQDWETYQPVVEYLYRPEFAYEYYEDVLMLSFLYGCEVFPETNKPNIRTYFIERGYKNFLMVRPKITVGQFTIVNKEGGAQSSELIIRAYTEALQDWVRFHSHMCKFDRTLMQVRDFQPSNAKNRTKSDLAVSFGFSLLSTMKGVQKNEKNPPNICDFFG